MKTCFDFAEYLAGRFTPGKPAYIERRGGHYCALFRVWLRAGLIGRGNFETLYILAYKYGKISRRDIEFSKLENGANFARAV